jgi:hypothetical protein
LPFKYNVKNSKICAERIKELDIHSTYRMLTLDITNLYTNIPNKEVIELITTELQDNSHYDVNIRNEVTELIKVTTKQEFEDTVWQQENGTPMRSPISSIFAEIFLQNLEMKFYPHLICSRWRIQFIGKYVDDVLIICDSTKATAEDILADHNNLHPSMKYNLEVEHNGSINFLDLNLFRCTMKFCLVFTTSQHILM